ncbi:MAG: 1-deoxy-D-xylulose-5-phosphate reductoisomerase [Clostridia bacterium]|nr:1-deoxy-D-xylulose-5-phosphate reductoisomerase [Clostridia bacterium]
MTKDLVILGSTGSVGKQALDVCDHLGIRVVGISGRRSISALEEQIRKYKPIYCAVADEKSANELKIAVRDTDTKIISGERASETLCEISECDTVLNSLSGIAGLRPTVATVLGGKKLALANKESLVTYGTFVMREAKKRGVDILPVDSEHSAIFQCLTGQKVKKLILTASGGPFYGKSREELEKITPAEALAHPTWDMGNRITIDSSTMMNKGFEVIEAAHLFGVDIDDVEVTVHRESIIHSMVEYIDNAIIAEMGVPDMRLCVQYALTYPERFDSPVKELDFKTLRSLTFGVPDDVNFPLLPLARRAFTRGGIVPAVMNGADEMAVELFLRDKLTYLGLSDAVIRVTEEAENIASPTLSDIEEADRWARIRIKEIAEA